MGEPDLDQTHDVQTQLQKKLEPIYRSISAVTQRYKQKKLRPPKALLDLAEQCCALDRRIRAASLELLPQLAVEVHAFCQKAEEGFPLPVDA